MLRHMGHWVPGVLNDQAHSGVPFMLDKCLDECVIDRLSAQEICVPCHHPFLKKRTGLLDQVAHS